MTAVRSASGGEVAVGGRRMAGQSTEQVELKFDDAPAQRHIIKRPRLTKLLDEANARIILLIAPAGYGKTTLAREWTTRRGRRGLWYRARKGSSDVAILSRGLSQALAPLSPTIERSTRELLAALSAPDDEPEAIADLLADELDEWPAGTWGGETRSWERRSKLRHRMRPAEERTQSLAPHAKV